MNYSTLKFSSKALFILLISAASIVYSSCSKSSTTTTSSTPVTKATIFTASVNGSPVISFVGSKSTASGTTSLIGVSSSYTITLSFPSTTGTGNFFFSSTGFNASIVNGSNTYVSNATYGSGTLTIDSITGGKYYGYFSFIGQTTSLASMNVSGGRFSNL